MPHDEVNELKILIAQVAGELKSLTCMVTAMRDDNKSEKDKAQINSEKIIRLEEKLKTAQEDIDRNFEQHRQFYDVQDDMQKLKGMGLTLKIVFGTSIASLVGVLYKIFGG